MYIVVKLDLMKKLLLLLLLVPIISFGQTKDEMELCMAFQSRSFYSDTVAENALDKILSVTGQRVFHVTYKWIRIIHGNSK